LNLVKIEGSAPPRRTDLLLGRLGAGRRLGKKGKDFFPKQKHSPGGLPKHLGLVRANPWADFAVIPAKL